MKTNAKLTAEELQKLRTTDFSKKEGFVKASEVLAKEAGEIGTSERETFDTKTKEWFSNDILKDSMKDNDINHKLLKE